MDNSRSGARIPCHERKTRSRASEPGELTDTAAPRRRLMKALAAGSAAFGADQISRGWRPPVVTAVVAPSHAQTTGMLDIPGRLGADGGAVAADGVIDACFINIGLVSQTSGHCVELRDNGTVLREVCGGSFSEGIDLPPGTYSVWFVADGVTGDPPRVIVDCCATCTDIFIDGDVFDGNPSENPIATIVVPASGDPSDISTFCDVVVDEGSDAVDAWCQFTCPFQAEGSCEP